MGQDFPPANQRDPLQRRLLRLALLVSAAALIAVLHRVMLGYSWISSVVRGGVSGLFWAFVFPRLEDWWTRRRAAVSRR